VKAKTDFRVKQNAVIILVAERLLASEAVLCRMKFVIVKLSRLSGWHQSKGLSFFLLHFKQLFHSLLQTHKLSVL
jgi:hypothetical protein